jgi:UDP-glucuronate 4-epimerase
MASLVVGLGYIGVPLVRALLARGDRVVGIDNGFSTDRRAVRRLSEHARFTLVWGSINRQDPIDRALSTNPTDPVDPIDTVYLLAAQASAHPLAASPEYTEATNLAAPRRVLEAVAARGALRWVYASSFRVYGDDLSGEVAESAPLGRIGDLSHLSKVYAEKLIDMLAARHSAAAANVRLGVVYGLGPLMKRDPRFLTVPNLFAMRAARGEPLTVHPGAARPIGFLHLDDAVAALLAAAEQAPVGSAATYNAVGEVLSVPEVAAIARDAAAERGLRVDVVGDAPPPTDRFAVRSSLRLAAGWPTRRMAESLGEVIDHYRVG